MSKSKEEILRSQIGLLPMANLTEGQRQSIYAAMDEYAKQESIAFVEWFASDNNPYQKQYNSDDDNDGKWYDYYSEGINRHYFTTEQLYTLFTQSKNEIK